MKPERPKQSVPSEIVTDLMGAIRHQFYPDATAKKWGQDSHFIKIRVVLWPASWLNKRGVTLPPERYKQIVLEVLNEIKVHGQTAVVKYWPGYLAKCIQERFKHRSEAIYEEGKAVRSIAEQTLSALGRLAPASPDPVRVMAEARHDLLKAHRAKRKKDSPCDQLSLL